LGIAAGMFENMERLKLRELDGVFYQYLRIRNAIEHRFWRLSSGGRREAVWRESNQGHIR
jgi:hypothetical protein